jgi:hypothetical protein
MNLGQIRQEIADALSFDPTSSTYDESVIRRVNNVYRQLCSSDPWDFLQKTVVYPVMPDMLGQGTDPLVAWTMGSAKADVALFGLGYNYLALEGAIATDPAGFRHNIGTISFEPGGTFIRTWQNSQVTASAPAELEFQRWRLPADCVDVLGIVNRENQYGPLRAVTEWEEQRYPLYTDQRGTPLAYVLENQVTQEYRTVNEYGPLNNAQLGTEFGQKQYVRPPDVRDVTLTSIAVGDLVPGVTYEYMLTWVAGGIETGPSHTLEHTATDVGVRFTNLPVIGQPPIADWGANKVLYRRRRPAMNDTPNEPYGGWYRLLNQGDGAASGFLGLWSDATTTDDGLIEQMLDQRYYEPLPAHYFRLYPKPDRVLNLSIRYHYLPPLLEEDRDIPAIPQEFHSILVHLVVEQIAAQADGTALATHHAKLSASLIEKMRRRYLTSRSTNTRRQLWGTHHSFLIKPKIEFSGP